MKKVKVNHSILSAGKDYDGSLSDLVGREGVVVGSVNTYTIVDFGGFKYPFEKHELTEVRNDTTRNP